METLPRKQWKTGFIENIFDTLRHFFEKRMLPGAEIEMVQLFPIQQLSLSENRSRDVKIAHVGAYRSYFLVGLAACLENL